VALQLPRKLQTGVQFSLPAPFKGNYKMRNLLEYPIREEEMIQFLEDLRAKEEKRIVENMICGDHSLVIIDAILNVVKKPIEMYAVISIANDECSCANRLFSNWDTAYAYMREYEAESGCDMKIITIEVAEDE
jgi:hypothetical protein